MTSDSVHPLPFFSSPSLHPIFSKVVLQHLISLPSRLGCSAESPLPPAVRSRLPDLLCTVGPEICWGAIVETDSQPPPPLSLPFSRPMNQRAQLLGRPKHEMPSLVIRHKGNFQFNLASPPAFCRVRFESTHHRFPYPCSHPPPKLQPAHSSTILAVLVSAVHF